MTETVYCALCEVRLELDDEHVAIDAEVVLDDARNGIEDYVACVECWHGLTRDWAEPA